MNAPHQRPTVHHQRTAARAVTVGLTVAAALVTWFIARQLLDIDIHAPAMSGQLPAQITTTKVVASSATAALAAWALLAVLERITHDALPIWRFTAAGVFLLSLLPPLTGQGISTASRTALTILHVGVAGILIPGLSRTARGASPTQTATPHQEA